MKYLVKSIIFLCMLMRIDSAVDYIDNNIETDCDSKKYVLYNSENDKNHRQFIESYLTDEYLGKNSYLTRIEFEVFGKDDTVGPPDCYDRIPKAYPYWVPGTDCYALTLSSGETIILECISRKIARPGCFKMIGSGKGETICVKVFGERCVGITTPQGLTVALRCHSSYTCYPDIEEILKERYAKLPAESYNLYPSTQRCYEVYGENQELSPYNCRKTSNPENYACVDLIPGKKQCLGLKTRKNETIELVCGNSVEDVFSSRIHTKKCFNVRGPDGSTESVCQKKIGNYSIGITTPRKDSILFHSYFCKTYKTFDDLKIYREFIENFAYDPRVRSCYKVYTQNQQVSPYTCLNTEVYDACVQQLDDPNCIGITTQNDETIVLQCSNRRPSKAGCFEVYTPYNSYSICETKLDEGCIGLVTQSNLKVLLECNNCTSLRGAILPSYRDPVRLKYRKFVIKELDRYRQGNYSFEVGSRYKVYGPQQEIIENDCFVRDYVVHELLGHDNCTGITLENLETIVLDCPGKTKNGCYDIFMPIFGANNKIVGPEEKVATRCMKALNEQTVGPETPMNMKIGLGNPNIVNTMLSIPSRHE